MHKSDSKGISETNLRESILPHVLTVKLGNMADPY